MSVKVNGHWSSPNGCMRDCPACELETSLNHIDKLLSVHREITRKILEDIGRVVSYETEILEDKIEKITVEIKKNSN